MKTLTITVLTLSVLLIFESHQATNAESASQFQIQQKSQFKGYNSCPAGYQRKHPHMFFFDRSCVKNP
ncbi:MAG TPA: hypothetical protein VMW10_10275 [Alphaproteobacteria bacterium]|nr:hypothetical protein [Alphaproteobacteria bacterium]